MRLTVKVLAALLLAVAVALAAASWLIDRNIGSTYRTYVDNAGRRQLQQTASQVALLYAVQPDWGAVQEWLDQLPRQAVMGNMHGRMMGRGPARQSAQPSAANEHEHAVLVAPDTGTPLATGGAPVSAVQLAAGAPVNVNGRTVAILVPASTATVLGAAEIEVLDEVQRAILSAALIGGLVAALLGGFLAWTIARPVRALQRSVMALAAGDRQIQVPVHSRDELGDLARAFNQMALTLHQEEKLRQRMLADIAHELRTPLSVVQGNLQAILDGVYPLALSEINTVFAETQLLSRLIHDLHELAQAEAGSLPLEIQSVDVTTAIARMAALFAPLAEARQIDLRVTAQPGNLTIQVDPDRLQQILHNLIGNAIRHTPPGGSVFLSAEPADARTVRISVTDSGPGIPPEHLPHLFERLYRVDGSRTRADAPTAGAGLGLAIARALTEAHGGSIGVSSPPGQGATFWVDLPLSTTQAPTLSQSHRTFSLPPASIL